MKKRENKIKPIMTVSTHYICEQNLQHIDIYLSDDEDEEGKTVAVVDRDTKKVIFKENNYINDKLVLNAISDVQESIKIKAPIVFIELREGFVDKVISEIDLTVRSLYFDFGENDKTFLITKDLPFIDDEEAVVEKLEAIVDKDRVMEILDCITKKPSDKLINEVIKDIKTNLSEGDETALYELLKFIPKEKLDREVKRILKITNGVLRTSQTKEKISLGVSIFNSS